MSCTEKETCFFYMELKVIYLKITHSTKQMHNNFARKYVFKHINIKLHYKALVSLVKTFIQKN